jgi:hypothetical protein
MPLNFGEGDSGAGEFHQTPRMSDSSVIRERFTAVETSVRSASPHAGSTAAAATLRAIRQVTGVIIEIDDGRLHQSGGSLVGVFRP